MGVKFLTNIVLRSHIKPSQPYDLSSGRMLKSSLFRIKIILRMATNTNDNSAIPLSYANKEDVTLAIGHLNQ